MSGGFNCGLEVTNSNAAGVSAGAGTTVTAGAAAYGSYQQLIASTPYDTSWVLVSFGWITQNLNNNAYLTIGIGGAGSEVPIFADYYMPYDGMGTIPLPLQIPAGTRIAAKMYGDGGADTYKIAMVLFDSNLSSVEGYAGCEAMAGSAPNITGSTASGASGTYGSWAQIAASTSRDYVGFMPVIAPQNAGAVTGATYEIGVGSAGNEVPILVDMAVFSSLTRGSFPNQFIPTPIPAGTRISYRTTVSGGSPVNFRMACMGVF